MRGRRIFDHVDPYLAPPEHDPPESSDEELCDGEGCWLAQFSDVPCDGRLVAAHLIPQQRIKREYPHGAELDLNKAPYGWYPAQPLKRGYVWREIDGFLPLESLLWDERVWVPACGGPTGIGGHHGMLDGGTLSVPRSALPEGLEAFAEEYGLVWSLDRDFGLREAVA